MSPDLFAKGVFKKPTAAKAEISPTTAFSDPFKNAKRAQKVPDEEIRWHNKLDDVEELTEYSAGGIIINGSQVVLIAKLSRKNKKDWTFPKGHIEKDEAPADAAVREVFEETGLQTHIVDRLGVTDYWFFAGNIKVHKYVYYFILEADGGALKTEEISEENIIDVRWIEKDDLQNKLSYPAEKKLVKFAFDRMSL
jgi:8-oxo-dGTP pyrophosphatase MutT (NUDIX family)